IGFGIKSIIPNITTFGDYSEDKIWDNIIKIKIKKKLYSYNTNSIKRKGQLFKATFKLPSNTAIGGYFVKAVVLKQNGEISNYATDYFVTERYGVINTIYSTARDYPHIYAIIVILLSLLIGLIAGYRKN
ncbi:MAG: TIGR02186 family protein, partial [Alphaproteobacteria bacterium]